MNTPNDAPDSVIAQLFEQAVAITREHAANLAADPTLAARLDADPALRLETAERLMPPDENPRRFQKGNWVRYVPGHARGDMRHKDCEDGVVKRQSEDGQTVFVLYDNLNGPMTTGDEPYTAQATSIDDLRLMGIKRLLPEPKREIDLRGLDLALRYESHGRYRGKEQWSCWDANSCDYDAPVGEGDSKEMALEDFLDKREARKAHGA